ncbi:2Fe-2S iron-sulfur cluster-binding protein [Chlorobium sp. N1]|uniref:2Fe-2S iron-sulfur cluster-binding protein n=1 Tax=Chlorobium sp. N1 TaxID=2491138 RepID=UPI00103D4089|nr:2Fe-2S iron-sulfur cluster-binding protein [Chlorobium sp. N1]TCD48502.1 (2Fe-2S)-binding protein [Chlorobium sp. N1]
MQIIINDKPCDASIGQTISKAARLNHSHVGYLCGAHGVCQTCQVIVLEGGECLSPLNDVEEAFLTPKQVASGIRMACRATIERKGPIRILSRPEAVRRMLFTDPMPLFEYGAEIGTGLVSQALPGLGNLLGRVVKGELFNEDELEELRDSLEGLVGLTVETLPEYLPFKDELMGMIKTLPVELPAELQQLIPNLKLPIGLPFMETKRQKKSAKAVQIAFTHRKPGSQDRQEK